MDASIMCGKTLRAGAVTQVQYVKNPIALSRMVMDRSEHVFLAGMGAEAFACEMGLEFCSDEYFHDNYRYRQYLNSAGRLQLDHSDQNDPEVDKPTGTVGAVALDRYGDVAAATSTGGMTNKRFGRVGDSPVIGAGTYADNATCAVSCTGQGEYFLRGISAYDLSALIEYAGLDLERAADRVIDRLGTLGGDGGLVAVNRAGTVIARFNSAGMYRALMSADGKMAVDIFD
jgi:beta-aspartyl-peptidase (threonine type)